MGGTLPIPRQTTKLHQLQKYPVVADPFSAPTIKQPHRCE